jgi:UDP-N-acetylmuramate dehydrogenase
MKIESNIPLAHYTTFKTGGPARFFCSVTNEQELLEAINFSQENKLAVFILGGGSNVLINDKGFDGLVIKIEIQGIEMQESKNDSDQNALVVSAGAGEQWDSFVEYAVGHGLYGIENLSAIPGTVGAAPVQNIGAYGSEVSQTIQSVRAYDTQQSTFVEFSNTECQFTYRDSLFKKEKGRYVITRVDFLLSRQGSVNIEYKDVKEYFGKIKNEKSNIKNLSSTMIGDEAQGLNTNFLDSSTVTSSAPTLKQVREAIIDIRWNKLPDWKLWGTAGSFFKNPIISQTAFNALKEKYPDLPGFPESDNKVKVSLGWILDKVCNMKGLCIGNVCTYEKQALVLVAKPGATSEEIVNVAKNIMNTVKEKTGIDIEGEVEWVN